MGDHYESNSDGGSEDQATTTAATGSSTTRSVATIAHGPAYSDADVEDARLALNAMVRSCRDIVTADQAADLYANAVSLIEKDRPSIDAADTLVALEDLFVSKGSVSSCRDLAIGYVAIVIG